MSSESMKAIHSLRAAKIPRFRAAAGPPFRWQRQVTRSPKDLAVQFHGTVFRAIVNNDRSLEQDNNSARARCSGNLPGKPPRYTRG